MIHLCSNRGLIEASIIGKNTEDGDAEYSQKVIQRVERLLTTKSWLYFFIKYQQECQRIWAWVSSKTVSSLAATSIILDSWPFSSKLRINLTSLVSSLIDKACLNFTSSID